MIKHSGWFLLLFAGIVTGLLILSPSIFRPSTVIIGERGNDLPNHIWGFRYVYENIRRGEFPLLPDRVNHPDGGLLYFIDTLNGLISTPFQIFLPLSTSFNITLLFNLSLNMISYLLLSLYVLKEPASSIIASLIFGLSPFLITEISNGITENLSLSYLIFSILFTLSLFKNRGLARGIVCGAFVSLTFFANIYYGFIGLLFIMIILSFKMRILSGFKPLIFLGALVVLTFFYIEISPFHPFIFLLLLLFPVVIASIKEIRPIHVWARGGAGFTAALLLLLLPYTLFFSSISRNERNLMKKVQKMEDNGVKVDDRFISRYDATDIISLFHPGNYFSPDLKRDYQENFKHTSYIPFILLVPFILSIIKGMRKEWEWIFLASSLIFLILSIGRYLFVMGDFVTVSGERLSLPFRFIEWVVSGSFGLKLEHSRRFFAGFLIFAPLIGGLSFRELFIYNKGWRVVILFSIFIVCIVVESLFLSPAPYPLHTIPATPPSFYHALAVEEGDFAVLDLPSRTTPPFLVTEYLYFQTFHGKKIPYSPMVSNRFHPLRENRFFLYGEESGIEDLLRKEFRYVVLHESLFQSHSRYEKFYRTLSSYCGDPIFLMEGMSVFKLSGSR